jgi:hypothetical protein
VTGTGASGAETTNNSALTSLPAPPAPPHVAAQSQHEQQNEERNEENIPTPAGNAESTGSALLQTANNPARTYSGTSELAYGTYEEAPPLEEEVYAAMDPSATSTIDITEEEPRATNGSPLLYGLLSIIILIGIGVGVVVVSLHRHEPLPFSKGVPVPRDAPLPAPVLALNEGLPALPVPSGTEAEGIEGTGRVEESTTVPAYTHHPSLLEARTYVQNLRERGYSEGEIREHFTTHGWTDEHAAIAMRRE